MASDVKPTVGQVWQDNDPRVTPARFVRIMAVGDTAAWCMTWYTGAENSPRRTRIKLTRFRPTSTGYRFVRDESGAGA